MDRFPIRVLLVEDHAIVRKSLCALLETESGIEVVGEARNGGEAVSKADSCEPDVILMDLLMPEMGGVEATRRIIERRPETQVLVLTSFGSEDQLFPAIDAGVLGFLLKDTAPNDVVKAIRQAADGYSAITPALAGRFLCESSHERAPETPGEPLTTHEIEVLKLLAHGYTNERIGNALFISSATVRAQVSKILANLALTNRTQAALYALRQGLVTLSENDQ